MPVVRKELFDKLLALMLTPVQRPLKRGSLSCGGRRRNVCDYDG